MPRIEVTSQIQNEESAKVYVYREVPGIESDRLDILEQLNANLDQLEELHGRLRFVMAEVRSILKKS